MSFNIQIALEMLEEVKNILDISLARPSQTPHLVILGGQPGSGKSSAIEIIEARLNDNVLSFNGDDFKQYYPNYQQILAKDPAKAIEEVQPYSNYVVNELKKEYSNKKYNMIIEGTMRTTEVPLSTITEFKNKGYQTEAYVIASNYYLSRVGCLYRMEMDIFDNGQGRSVSTESHDAAYNNIPETLMNLKNSGKLDNIIILSRNGQIIGNLKSKDDVISIYKMHRDKLSIHEFNQINESLNNVIIMMQNRGASINDIAKVYDLQRQIRIR